MQKVAKPATIDAYIAGFPEPVQVMLEEVRAAVRSVIPEAEETIKYDMPTFTLNGNVAHFAAFKNHIGFYPAPTGNPAFKEKLAGYKTGKGSIQFPFSKPLPIALIKEMVVYQLEYLRRKQ
jgi:uncharacterized protein YdhG (YjbR/CyaY superfamily)